LLLAVAREAHDYQQQRDRSLAQMIIAELSAAMKRGNRR
jgi:hypothetical protein